jgi:hypothetical protein
MAILKLGYEPKPELFHEISAEHYKQMEREGGDVSKKWYTILPDNPKNEVPELLIFDEEQKDSLLDGVKWIENFCQEEDSGQKFNSFYEKLEYVSNSMPAGFSEDTPFEKSRQRKHLKVIPNK